MSAKRLTDRTALLRNRVRASASTAQAFFLFEDAACEIEERLASVNRVFTAPALVGGLPEFWSARFPGMRVVADEEVLDLEPGAHDVVVHAMCLHWSEDPVGQMVQARHALCADGLFLALVLGGQTLRELRAALAQAEADLTGGLSPRVVPMGEIRDLGSLLQRAGFSLPVADSVLRTALYKTPLHLMHDLRDMGEANALAGRPRSFSRRALFQRAVEIYQKNHGSTDGRVPATFEIVALTGWCPAPNQPKPLRPGSAKSRLADALGTFEQPLPPQAKD